MLGCACGFTCGTRNAWRRHVDKFAGTDEALDHVQVPLVEGGGGASSRLARSLHGPQPLDLLDEQDPAARQLSLGSSPGSPSCGEAQTPKTPSEYMTPKTPARPATFTQLPWILRKDRDGASSSFASTARATTASGGCSSSPVTRQGRRDHTGSSQDDEPADLPARTKTCPSLAGPGRPETGAEPRAGICSRLAGAGRKVGLTRQLSPGGRRLRLLLVRHAQSANKCAESRKGSRGKKEADPELSFLGYDQANALVSRLKTEVGDQYDRRPVLVVSSPMRRCLLTIQPSVQKLQLPARSTFCHGRCYEFGCAGTAHRGSSAEAIRLDFPEFEPVGFSAAGTWDYRGDNVKETELECRERGLAIAEWLREEAPSLLEAADGSPSTATPTIILCSHQTISDLLCQILVDGTARRWEYGEIRYGLHNTGITELFLNSDGSATFGFQDDCFHADGLAAAPIRRRSYT